MLDSKGCSFEANGGTLRVSKGNKEMLLERKTKELYQLEGSVQTVGGTIRYGSSGTSKQNGQGKQLWHRFTRSKRRDTWKIHRGIGAQRDVLRYVQNSS